MVTKEEREKAFREDLDALLKKHYASIELVEVSTRFPNIMEEVMEVELKALYTTQHDCAEEYTIFSLGRSIS